MKNLPTYSRVIVVVMALLWLVVFWSPWLKAPTDFGGPPPSAYSPRSIVTYYHAKGGTNDDTAKFQLALNSGIPTYIDKSFSYYTVGNLYLTNNSVMYSHGATIKFKTNSVGNMFYGVTGISNVWLGGLVLDGQKYGFQNGGYPWGGSFFSDIVRRSAPDRTGILMCSDSINSTVTHCQSHGFSYAGYSFYGAFITPQPEYTPVRVDNLNATFCWIGFETATNAEYMRPDNITTAACGRGLSIESGNNHFTGGQDTKCGVAVRVAVGQGIGVNTAHSEVASRTMNHCSKAFEAYNFNNGFNFIGCMVLGSGGITITNCTGVTFQNGVYGGDSTFRGQFGADIIVDGGAGNFSGMNYFLNNGVITSQALIVAPNSGLMLSSGNYNVATGGVLPYTNSWTGTFTGASNAFTSPVYVPNLIVSGSGGLTLPTNSTAPGNTTTIRAWYTVTNNTGGVFKAPLYQ